MLISGKYRCAGCTKELNSENEVCSCGYDNGNMQNPSHCLQVGEVLANQYVIGKVIGEGGFGITYVGWDQDLDIKVAVKEFFPNGFSTRNTTVSATVSASMADDGEFFDMNREKFIKEAKTLATFMNEPGIVSVYRYFSENNTVYIIMEYIEGISLKEYLKRKGKLTVEETIGITGPIMNSLAKVHEKGVIHRDISPDNIMITNDGQGILIDFGAAREANGGQKSLSVVLKHGFAPIEQYQSRGDQGPWTDVYALSATIYRAITGVVPMEAIDRMAGESIKSVCELEPSCPKSVSDAIMKGLSVSKNDRYKTVGEMKTAIMAALNSGNAANRGAGANNVAMNGANMGNNRSWGNQSFTRGGAMNGQNQAWGNGQAANQAWGNGQRQNQAWGNGQRQNQAWGNGQAANQNWNNGQQAGNQAWGNNQTKAGNPNWGNSQAQAGNPNWGNSQALNNQANNGQAQAVNQTWGNSQALNNQANNGQVKNEQAANEQAANGQAQAANQTWGNSQALNEQPKANGETPAPAAVEPQVQDVPVAQDTVVEQVQKPEKKKGKKKFIILAAVIVVLLAIGGGVGYVAYDYSNSCYSAGKYAENGEFTRANSELTKYKKLALKFDKQLCDYIDAGILYENKDYKSAEGAFNKLGNYRQSEHMSDMCSFYIGIENCDELARSGKYDDALKLLNNLKYPDVATRDSLYLKFLDMAISDAGKSGYDFIFRCINNFKKAGINCVAQERTAADKFDAAIQNMYETGKSSEIVDAIAEVSANSNLGLSSNMELFYALSRASSNKDIYNVLVEHADNPYAQNKLFDTKYIYDFLRGTWRSGSTYFTMNRDNSITYNMPIFSGGTYDWKTPGVIYIASRKTFEFTIISRNEITIHDYKDNKTYRLKRSI
ncbi:MAG: protein kinase [Lachnospiraceae bacterium]|nr:protein kinase [Candidatus Colinaster scatohippi]